MSSGQSMGSGKVWPPDQVWPRPPGQFSAGWHATRGSQPAADPDAVRLRDIMMMDAKARFDQALAAPAGFAERWVMFWSNHFCVALRRGQIMQGVTGPYEREAIRPHVFGGLPICCRGRKPPGHAALPGPAPVDWPELPRRPAPPARAERESGPEILELHTLGVSGGYSQADVTSFAKALTGWSITGFEENIDGFGGYTFAPNRHEPGPKTVLGKTYPQEGKAQGLAILADLARHPATASFIATKLARHFVADQPPPALVNRLAANFRETGGDLAALARTLLTAPESWSAPAAKMRMPQEFLIATLRAFAAPRIASPAC